MTAPTLDVLAGSEALEEIRTAGLDAKQVRLLVGASGGAKWLVLHGLDQVVFPWLLATRSHSQPLHAVGSSIGSWRMACLATRAPVAAIDRLAEAYVEQCYAPRPSAAEVSRGGDQVLASALGRDGVAQLVEPGPVRLHVVTARFRHLGAFEGGAQLAGLGLAAVLNGLHRRALNASIERVVFDAGDDPGPCAPWRSLATRHVALTRDNAWQALSASAAIPRVMAGVRNPSGAPLGTYRDGGVADYHFGSEIDLRTGIALYPHFFAELVPGWFDKRLRWRRTRGLRRVVVLAPSAAHVASLPGGRIPDRSDFTRMDDATRIVAWRRVLELGARLGESFAELVASGRIRDAVRPLG